MAEVLTNSFHSKFTTNDKIIGQSSDVINKCLNLGYRRRDIDRMYSNFKKLDVYHKNTIIFASLCQVYRINTPFGELIFRQLLGIEKNKELSFEDYLVCIWNSFSVFDHKSMAQLTFQIFDADNSGLLSMSEVGKMVTVIYGNESQKYGIVMKALKQEDHKKPLSQADFVKLTRKLPLLLFPIFKLLTVGEENTLGVRRWKEIRKLKEKTLSSSAGSPSGKHLIKVGKVSIRHIKLDKSGGSTKSDHSGSGSAGDKPRTTSGSYKGKDGRRGSDPKAPLRLGPGPPGTRQGSSRGMEPKTPLRLGAGGRQASIDRFKSLEMSREVQGSFRERRKSIDKGPSFIDHKLMSQTSRRGSHLGELNPSPSNRRGSQAGNFEALETYRSNASSKDLSIKNLSTKNLSPKKLQKNVSSRRKSLGSAPKSGITVDTSLFEMDNNSQYLSKSDFSESTLPNGLSSLSAPVKKSPKKSPMSVGFKDKDNKKKVMPYNPDVGVVVEALNQNEESFERRLKSRSRRNSL
mmetsp:Transcript_16230/g.15571  ORF Transcript_16230/g.15571 Transcript_16230/m.15571 type:complete len:518 (-) Transcript_16230:211-1764(-)